MIEVDDLEKIILGFGLLGPGFLIMYGRSRFLTGRMTSVASSVFEYLMVSSIYFAGAYPIFGSIREPNNAATFVFLFAGPLAIGFLLGIAAQRDYFRIVLGYLKLNPIHTSPTGWDYVFNGRKGFSWVVVKLNSGGQYYGIFGPESLASSDLSKRDIYLENTCDESFKPIETDGRKRGVWISEDDIRSIEIVEDR